jgi:hypothetical protein
MRNFVFAQSRGGAKNGQDDLDGWMKNEGGQNVKNVVKIFVLQKRTKGKKAGGQISEVARLNTSEGAPVQQGGEVR